MLNCKDITEKANDYIDSNMSVITRTKLQMHLFMCVNCRNYVKQLKTTIGAIRGLSQTPEVSDSDIEKTLSNIKKQLGDDHTSHTKDGSVSKE